jgi:hypothetical protein
MNRIPSILRYETFDLIRKYNFTHPFYSPLPPEAEGVRGAFPSFL